MQKYPYHQLFIYTLNVIIIEFEEKNEVFIGCPSLQYKNINFPMRTSAKQHCVTAAQQLPIDTEHPLDIAVVIKNYDSSTTDNERESANERAILEFPAKKNGKNMKKKIVKKRSKGEKKAENTKKPIKFFLFQRNIRSTNPIKAVLFCYISLSQGPNISNQSKVALKDIIDWQNQAASFLYLTKDAFYCSLAISHQIFTPHFLFTLNDKIVKNYACAILNDNSVNYTAVISSICRISRQQLIQTEFAIFKKINFRIPHFTVYDQIMEICTQWNIFMNQNMENLRINYQILQMGELKQIQDWSNYVLNKMEDVFYFFDVFAIKSVTNLMLGGSQHIFRCATFSLFTVINYHAKQFFPIQASHKTYLLLLFHAFLIKKYNFCGIDNQMWTNKLVYLRNSLDLIQNGEKYFSQKYDPKQAKQNVIQQTSDIHYPIVSQQPIFYKQKYQHIIAQW